MTISIVNHKGGTGKTTTTINLGSALAEEGYHVLLVDFDAQGSLSYSLGIEDHEPTITDAFFEETPIQTLFKEREGMDVLPAGPSLADVELTMAKADDRLHHLKKLLDQVHEHDFVFIDCPPSLSLLTLNALIASDCIIVPMQMDVLALRGLDAMLDTVKNVTPHNPALSVLGILPVMTDTRKNIHQEIHQHIKTHYTVPLFQQAIRSCVKVAEAPSFGKSVIHYAPGSTATYDFKAFAREVLERTNTYSYPGL